MQEVTSQEDVASVNVRTLAMIKSRVSIYRLDRIFCFPLTSTLGWLKMLASFAAAAVSVAGGGQVSC